MMLKEIIFFTHSTACVKGYNKSILSFHSGNTSYTSYYVRQISEEETRKTKTYSAVKEKQTAFIIRK